MTKEELEDKKQELIEKLAHFSEYMAKLKLLRKRKTELQAKIKKINIESKITSKLDGNGHGTEISDSTGNTAMKNIKAKQEYEDEIKEIDEEIETIEPQLQDISIRLEGVTRKEREMIIARCIEGEDLEEIGNRRFYELYSQTRSAMQISRIIKKGLEKMIQM